MMVMVIDTTTPQKFRLGTCHHLVNAESGIQIALLVSNHRPAIAARCNIVFLAAPTSFGVRDVACVVDGLRLRADALHNA